MNKALIITCSLSGCTERMGEIIAETMKQQQIDILMKTPDEVTKEDLEEHDHILIGTYTYSTSTTDKASIPFELEDLIDRIEESNPAKKYFGVFGSCDSSYRCYGEGIDLLAFKLFSFGGKIFRNRLKIELYPETNDQIKECETFASDYVTWSKTK